MSMWNGAKDSIHTNRAFLDKSLIAVNVRSLKPKHITPTRTTRVGIVIQCDVASRSDIDCTHEAPAASYCVQLMSSTFPKLKSGNSKNSIKNNLQTFLLFVWVVSTSEVTMDNDTETYVSEWCFGSCDVTPPGRWNWFTVPPTPWWTRPWASPWRARFLAWSHHFWSTLPRAGSSSSCRARRREFSRTRGLLTPSCAIALRLQVNFFGEYKLVEWVVRRTVGGASVVPRGLPFQSVSNKHHVFLAVLIDSAYY